MLAGKLRRGSFDRQRQDFERTNHVENIDTSSTSHLASCKMSSFFTLPASQRKRKRNDVSSEPSGKKRLHATGSNARTQNAKPARAKRDESISGSESDDEGAHRRTTEVEEENEDDSESGHEDETGAERRLRLAERYLENLKGEADEIGYDAAEIDKDLIAERLKEDVVCFLLGVISFDY